MVDCSQTSSDGGAPSLGPNPALYGAPAINSSRNGSSSAGRPLRHPRHWRVRQHNPLLGGVEWRLLPHPQPPGARTPTPVMHPCRPSGRTGSSTAVADPALGRDPTASEPAGHLPRQALPRSSRQRHRQALRHCYECFRDWWSQRRTGESLPEDEGCGAKLTTARLAPQLVTLTGHTANVTSLAWHAEAKWLVSGSEDGTVKIWDVR